MGTDERFTIDQARELLDDLIDRAARRRRRMGVLRRMVPVVSAIGIAIAVVAPLRGLLGSRVADTAAPSGGVQPSYVIDVTRLDVGKPGTAEVWWGGRWTSDEYPGHHSCTFAVFDASGVVIGRLDTSWDSLDPIVKEFPAPAIVEINGSPASADVVCGPERIDEPVAYVISEVRVLPRATETGAPGFFVRFRIDWPDDLPVGAAPSTNACSFRVTAVNPGEQPVVVSQHRGTFSAPPGTYDSGSGVIELLAGFPDLSDYAAEVVCHPFTGADVHPSDLP